MDQHTTQLTFVYIIIIIIKIKPSTRRIPSFNCININHQLWTFFSGLKGNTWD